MPIKYVPFIPEPIEGQAVLGNFNRILKYKGADETSMVLQRGMPLYEMEKQETVSRLIWSISTRPLPAVRTTPKRFTFAGIPRWRRPLPRRSRNWILTN